MDAKQFNENFAALTNSAIAANVPLHEILLTLESAKFEIQFTMFRRAQANAAQQIAEKIWTPQNGQKPNLPPPPTRQ